MSTKLRSKINIKENDRKAAGDILKTLKAPVTEENIDNLKTLVGEVGEMYEEAYNAMLVKLANDKLATYDARCPCGNRIQVHLTCADLDTWGNC